MPRAKKKPLAEPQAEQPPWEEPVDLPFAPPEWAASNRERRLVKDLRPWPRNPRRHSDAQIAQLARSLQEFGQTKPILIDDKDVILAGHGTVEACRKAGIEELEVVVARGWPQAKKRAYVIADNQLAITAEWDIASLQLELGDLNLDGFDLTLLGFPEVELADLLGLGDGGNTGTPGSLAAAFGVPPFSVLNAREGWWQERKKAWLALGIQSELGRGVGAPCGTDPGITEPGLNHYRNKERVASFKNQGAQSALQAGKPHRKRRANAIPGVGMMPLERAKIDAAKT